MKTLVIYYSYNGSTRRAAQCIAQELSADLYEVKDVKRPGMLGAFVKGCFAAMRQKPTPVQPITADFDAYDEIIVMAPIWAGMPAPAINNVLSLLPAGKEVSLRMVSSSGTSRSEDIVAKLEERGVKVRDYVNLQGAEQ